MPDHKFRPGQLVNLSAVLIPGSPHMCARGIEIDDQTDRYRELAEYVRDPAARRPSSG
jgi:hypothetical protein